LTALSIYQYITEITQWMSRMAYRESTHYTALKRFLGHIIAPDFHNLRPLAKHPLRVHKTRL